MIELEGKKIRLQIWDTAGQERFRTITAAYYRGAMGILLVYDITDELSFKNLEAWIGSIEENTLETPSIILVGNKCDMECERAVPKQLAMEFAKRHGIGFLEVSAKMNVNVEKMFLVLVKQIKTKMDNSSGEKYRGTSISIRDSNVSRTCCDI